MEELQGTGLDIPVLKDDGSAWDPQWPEHHASVEWVRFRNALRILLHQFLGID